MSEKIDHSVHGLASPSIALPNDAFSRADETNDAIFYERARFVSHLDSRALATIEQLIGRQLAGVAPGPVILDLMASWDSHLPKNIEAAKVIGLGLNANELAKNSALTEFFVHDLNAQPQFPFDDNLVDTVLCTVSVEYLTRPFEVFREVGRILKPGGIFSVIFSNRYFPSKVVKVWRESSDDARLLLVHDFFRQSCVFEPPRVFVSAGKQRPPGDKYADLGIPSDPVYAVYAKHRGESVQPTHGVGPPRVREVPDRQEIADRKKNIKDSLQCPYCREGLEKWIVPESPFTEWPNEFFYVCFNDECPYYEDGWSAMVYLGNFGSYRLMYDPRSDACRQFPALFT